MRKLIIEYLLLMFIITGCTTKFTAQWNKPLYNSLYAHVPVNIDGKLNDAVWEKAPQYQLQLPVDFAKTQQIENAGYVQFAWDDTFFYLAVFFKDKDVVAEGTQDQIHHYRLGDLCELFLKPENNRHYWELYITPAGKKTIFFFPSKGYLGLPSCNSYVFELKVAAEVQGTLNNWRDVDKSWTGEMAVPISELEKYGDKFIPGQSWRILIGRYNYSVYLDDQELSSLPALPETNFHLYSEYGYLTFVNGNENQ